MNAISQDILASESLWDDMDHLPNVKKGELVFIVGSWKLVEVEKVNAKAIFVAGGRKFSRTTGDMVSKKYASYTPRILPVTTRTVAKSDEGGTI